MPDWTAYYPEGTQQGGMTDGSFSTIDHDRLVAFSITCDGLTIALHLDSGRFVFTDNDEGPKVYEGPPPPADRRLVAYVEQSVDLGGMMLHQNAPKSWAIGWQTTDRSEPPWRNVQFICKVFLIPQEFAGGLHPGQDYEFFSKNLDWPGVQAL